MHRCPTHVIHIPSSSVVANSKSPKSAKSNLTTYTVPPLTSMSVLRTTVTDGGKANPSNQQSVSTKLEFPESQEIPDDRVQNINPSEDDGPNRS